MREGQLCFDDEITHLEARNGLRQFDAIRSLFLTHGKSFRFDRIVIQDLNRIAHEEIYS